MGKAIADASPAARRLFERVDAALGEPLSRLCFDGPMEELTLTHNTQPAIVATSCAVLAALCERYPHLQQPTCAAGHSLGEYSALVASGALDIEDAVRLCRLRGEAMQEAVSPGEGAMAALIGLEPHVVQTICADAGQEEVVEPANFNAPGQIVIAGHAEAVARAGAIVAQYGGKAVPLKVSAPFHCALMRPVAARLAPALDAVPVGPLAFPVLANVDALPNEDPDRVRSLLVQQIDAPVQWVRIIERMAADGVTHALEIGPGKVLAGLVKRISKQIRVLNVGDPAGVERVAEFLSQP